MGVPLRSLLCLGIWLASACASDGPTSFCGDEPCNGPAGLPCRCAAPRKNANAAGASATDPATPGGEAACDHYFAAQYTTACAYPRLPAAELARIRPRFISACLNQIAMPGSGMTPGAIEACASALDAIGCQWQQPPGACHFTGSLPGGAACNEAMQCHSGACQKTTAPVGPGGPANLPIHCGTCASALSEGQTCGDAGRCVTGFECITSMSSAKNPVYTCTKITEGDAGAACDELTALCKPGLYCSGGRCTALHENAGDACGSPSGPNGCKMPLTCSGQNVCAQPAAEGESCAHAQLCADGLGCDRMQRCAPLTWAEPGSECDATAPCRVNTCPRSLSPLGAGTCPTISADGESCTGQFNCDAFSDCLDGVCVLRDSVVCH